MAERILTLLEHPGLVMELFAVAVILVGLELAWRRYLLRPSEPLPEQSLKQLSINPHPRGDMKPGLKQGIPGRRRR